jgi:hypothetical protein
MTKEEAILQLENLKEHCNEMSKSNKMWKSDVIAIAYAGRGVGKTYAIDSMANNRNKMIVEELKERKKR